MKNPRPILALVGPTATGKTEVALRVAETMKVPILSADSMQVYRGMDVGTAKPSAEERGQVPHLMLDVTDPTSDFSVADYLALANPLLQEEISRGRGILVTGGTGYYVKALVDGLCESPPANPTFREECRKRAEIIGPEALHRELTEIDPEAAQKIHPRNVRRTIRALEVFAASGQTITSFRKTQPPSPWGDSTCFVGIQRAWEELDQRINVRVRKMMQQGLIEEVQALLAKGCTRHHTAMQAIGYKEVLEYLEGMGAQDELENQIAQATRRYARRQMTWWRPDKRIHWLLVTKSEAENRTAERVMEVWDSMAG